jgi:outer membrane protein OmpA-like peptidoglycan-associated protein
VTISLRLLLCALAAALLVPSPASAQNPPRIDVQHLHPSGMPDSGLAVQGGPGLPAWAISGFATFNGAATPQRTRDPSTMRDAILLDRQLVLEPGIALGLPFGFGVQFAWPFVVDAADTPLAQSMEFTGRALRGQGIGDPRFELSWRIAPIRELLVLAAANVTIPTGSLGAEMGAEPSATIGGIVGIEGIIAQILVLRANVGVRGRTGEAEFTAGLGRVFRAGSELTWAAGAEVRPLSWLHFLAEFYGSSTLGTIRETITIMEGGVTVMRNIARDPFGSAATTPLELLFGVRVHPIEDLEITPFGGAGLGDGYGTPAWRLGLNVRFYLHMHDDDGDGVGNEQDRCPNELEDRDGFEDDDGCPDLDNDADGIPDADDRCANQAGLARLGGCPDPDGDHDGVGEGDRCPDQAEDQDHFEDDDGCPEDDNDGDTIPDQDDRCPNEDEDRDGFEDADGCPEPDNDRDGLLDEDDRCPREAEDRDGFEDDDGCVEADNDGDGVSDGEDGPPDPGGHFGVCRNLPETAGGRDANDPDGCPDSAVRVDVAARRIRVPPVFFDSNADVIQQRSFADLEYVAEIMVANEWIRRIVVEGHTDDRGTDEFNQDLSERRAASVVRFLVERGVEATRLAPQGFGRSRPPTAEDDPACRRATSSACRQAARRVVFVIAEIATDEEAPASTVPQH